MSRVDVIVPCYKYGHYLRQCVESVLSQSHQDLRVLIIDDCSPDHTEEVARALVTQDRRVAYHRHRVNRGHIATYNEGLNWAAGDYTLLISADDLVAPRALERAVRFLDSDSSIGFIYGQAIYFQGNPTCSDNAREKEPRCISEDYVDFIEKCCALGSTTIRAPTVIVRTDLQKRIGGYVAELPHSADTEMWLRFAAHARVGFIDALQALKRNHAENMHLLFSPAFHLEQQKSAFDMHFAQFGNRLSELQRLRQLVERTIGEQAFWGAYHAFDAGDIDNVRLCLQLAERLHPPVKQWRSWRRLRLKQAIGWRIWAQLRSAVGMPKMQRQSESIVQ